VWDFKGKNILKGETDGSSYPNGGLRATHRAGGYLSVDPTSPIFLRGDTIFIPACLSSYYGHALDEKTPLLRASDALSKEGVRLLNLLGFKGVKSLGANIGLGAIVHQFSKIGSYSMIGMGAIITKKVEVQCFGMYVGNPAKYINPNSYQFSKFNLDEIAEIMDNFNKI
jgi:hypothetical protein